MEGNTVLPPGPDTLAELEFRKGLTPYVFLRDLARGRHVLEVGVGSGHGAWLLRASGAKRVVAADIDLARIVAARRLCSKGGGFVGVVADAQMLPFRPGSFDLVTCFEVIEHLRARQQLLAGLSRIVASGGLVLLSTPNRRVRLLPLQKPWNPEHVFEYRQKTFERAVRLYFTAHRLYLLHGKQEGQSHYERAWRQRPLRVYGLMLRAWVRRLIPTPLRARMWARLGPGSSAAASPPVPQHLRAAAEPVIPEKTSWAFRLGPPGTARALNFVAICGSQEAVDVAVAALET